MLRPSAVTIVGGVVFLLFAIFLNVFAKLYLRVPGLQVGPPNLTPVQTPFVPLRLMDLLAFCIQRFFAISIWIFSFSFLHIA